MQGASGSGARPDRRGPLPPPFDNVSKKQLAVAGVGAGALLAYALLKTKSSDLPRDFMGIIKLIKIKRAMDNVLKVNQTIADQFGATCKKYPDLEAIVFTDRPDALAQRRKNSFTYREVDIESNRIANWALSVGLKKGDTVALMMDNRPEFIITWLAMTKLGILISLINHNLRGQPLRHSFQVSKAKCIFIGEEHAEVITQQLREEVGGRWFCVAGIGGIPVPAGASSGERCNGMEWLDPLVDALNDSGYIPREARADVKVTDTVLYIFTSGTTGNPKAAKISHLRFQMAGGAFAYYFNFTCKDRVYCSLPLYHSAATLIGVCSTWTGGGTLILRRKFSAQSFWSDIREHRATIFQYIGELCRYLLAVPPSPDDGKHELRLAVGNGLRPDIWEEFQKRFKIPQIGEFYAATEGNVGLVNSFNKVGAVGYISPLLAPVIPARVVKFDVDKEAPVRNPKTGFCYECRPGEVGEMLGRIEPDDPLRQFLGYTDQSATDKKILRDVFTKGDMWFRTGDLLRVDKEGFIYFIDRIGDTFRWKGENVATTEVAEVLMTGGLGLLEANVYGVAIPNCDGRAGMACILPSPSVPLDLQKLYQLVRSELPVYAAPLFLRIMDSGSAMDVTSTFKHKKTELVQEGFNPSVIKEPLYFRDDGKGAFVRIDEALYNQICAKEFSARL